MSTVHNLTTKANDTFDRVGYWSAVETLRIGYRKYAVGGWTKEATGRLAQGGSLVAGPVVYTFGHATVIAATPLRDTNTYVDVQLGDHVSVAGSVYRIESAPNDNIRLERVIGDAPGCGKDCRCHDGSVNCWHADPETSRAVFERCDCEA